MKLLFLITLLPMILIGCDKTELFGYESFEHCVLETMKEQKTTVSEEVLKYAEGYCLRKFPGEIRTSGDSHAVALIERELTPREKEIIERLRKSKGLDKPELEVGETLIYSNGTTILRLTE